MAKEIKTEIIINAAPEKVWAVFTDFHAYENWNPFIVSIRGEVKVGCKISVQIHPPSSKKMSFNPTILHYERHKELRWLGHLLFAGLFDGEHQFKLIDNKNGTTTFIQSEVFRGILVPIFKKQLDNNTKQGFEEMNRNLKALVEQNRSNNINDAPN